MSTSFTLPFNPVIWPAVPHDFTGDNNLGFSTDDTTQRFTIGTRSITWDGSVHKYVTAGSAFTSYDIGVWNQATIANRTYEAINASSPAGSRTVTINESGITEDQFVSGRLLLFHATGGGSIYTVVGNTVSSESGTVILTLDRPLPVAISSSDSYELYASPFDDIRQGNSGNTRGFWGLPLALLTSGSYGWIKTWGVSFIAPQSTVGNQGLAACYFRHDGSIDIRGSIGANLVTDQYAGFRFIGSAGGDGPLMMLQVDIQKGFSMTMFKDGKRIPPEKVKEMAKEEQKKVDKKK